MLQFIMFENFIRRNRIVPRMVLVLSSYYFALILDWYMLLDNPTNPQSLFSGAYMTAYAGILKFYVESKPNDDTKN